MTRLLFAVVVVSAPAWLGCGSRRHMSKDYGTSVHQAFATQANTWPERPGWQPAGLDPDEARIVNENYKKSLTKSAAKPTSSGVIVVQPEQAGTKQQKGE